MAALAQSTVDAVRQRADIVEVVGWYVTLRKAGAEFAALCPFHEERTPSFHVSPSKQLFHCFGCGVGGDLFTFVMTKERIDFPGAVRILAERYSIPIEETREPAGGARSDVSRDQIFRLHEQVAAWFHRQLLEHAQAGPIRQYLLQRAVPERAWEEFGIGFAPPGWDNLLRWAASSLKLEPALLARAGLIVPRPSGSGFYDQFRDRIMFPIHDEQGRAIAFSGRLRPDAPETDKRKYVNSPETPVFHKGEVMYNLHRARPVVVKEGWVLVCEGQLDVVACTCAEIRNAVGTQGTALTDAHARLLKRFADHVVLALDSDAAGQKAVGTAFPTLARAGLGVRVVALPAGEDPSSLLRGGGAEALREHVAAARDYFDWMLDRLGAGSGPPADTQQRLLLAEEIVAAISTVPAPSHRSALLDRLAPRVGLRRAALEEELTRSLRRRPGRPGAGPEASAAGQFQRRAGQIAPAEEVLLQALLHDSRLAELALVELEAEELPDTPAGHVLRAMLRQADASGPVEPRALIADPAAAEASLISRLLLSAPPADLARAARDSLVALKLQWLDQEIDRLNEGLGAPDMSREAQDALLARKSALLDRLSNLKKIQGLARGV